MNYIAFLSRLLRCQKLDIVNLFERLIYPESKLVSFASLTVARHNQILTLIEDFDLLQSMGKSLTFEQSVREAIDMSRHHKCKNPMCETHLWKAKHELDLALLRIDRLQKASG